MRLISFLLMLSGFAIVLAALVLFSGKSLEGAFIVVGIAVECLGLGVLASGYRSIQIAPKPQRKTLGGR